MVFANSQNNMGRKKRVYLQEFGIIHSSKSKFGPTGFFFRGKPSRATHLQLVRSSLPFTPASPSRAASCPVAWPAGQTRRWSTARRTFSVIRRIVFLSLSAPSLACCRSCHVGRPTSWNQPSQSWPCRTCRSYPITVLAGSRTSRKQQPAPFCARSSGTENTDRMRARWDARIYAHWGSIFSQLAKMERWDRELLESDFLTLPKKGRMGSRDGELLELL
jgi:hypothetical protein